MNQKVSIHAPARGATARLPLPSPPPRVSIHAPARGATARLRHRFYFSTRFNSRAREGRDLLRRSAVIVRAVSIHAPARGATVVKAKKERKSKFQFTRPRGARRVASVGAGRSHGFQFTRPRGARHLAQVHISPYADVSIHAPARGATAFCSFCLACLAVSIHAPARGATPPPPPRRTRRNRFNSRAREGRDRIWQAKHLPQGCFNSRAREGRDSGFTTAIESIEGFNSRAREGRDDARLQRPEYIGGFNSRAREGRDRLQDVGCAALRVSIHAPARGATTCGNSPAHGGSFQFTRPRGARRMCADPGARRWRGFNSRAREGRDCLTLWWSPSQVSVSIHAPARGATYNYSVVVDGYEFQFTRPRGARHAPDEDAQREAIVSIHAPARGATRFPLPSVQPVIRFNSRAREGRDGYCYTWKWDAEVSIHAPARGATTEED